MEADVGSTTGQRKMLRAPEESVTLGRLTNDVRVGVSSWSDRSLTHDSHWYPKRSMRASERIEFYCRYFDVVEMESAYRFPITADVSHKWIEATPPGFTFDIPVWSLLCGQPTMPGSLWSDLSNEIKPERRENRRLYSSHLGASAMDECWTRFRAGLAPLLAADKLGALIIRLPHWFGPRDRNRDVLIDMARRLNGWPLAVEFAHADWLVPQEVESTLDFLDGLGMTFVCHDGAPDDPMCQHNVTATSSDLAILRLRGRNSRPEQWDASARGYRYDQGEVSELTNKVQHLRSGATNTHVLVSTCWRDDAVVNAASLQEALSA